MEYLRIYIALYICCQLRTILHIHRYDMCIWLLWLLQRFSQGGWGGGCGSESWLLTWNFQKSTVHISMESTVSHFTIVLDSYRCIIWQKSAFSIGKRIGRLIFKTLSFNDEYFYFVACQIFCEKYFELNKASSFRSRCQKCYMYNIS